MASLSKSPRPSITFALAVDTQDLGVKKSGDDEVITPVRTPRKVHDWRRKLSEDLLLRHLKPGVGVAVQRSRAILSSTSQNLYATGSLQQMGKHPLPF